MYIMNRAEKALCGIDSDDYVISNLVIALFGQRNGAHYCIFRLKLNFLHTRKCSEFMIVLKSRYVSMQRLHNFDSGQFPLR